MRATRAYDALPLLLRETVRRGALLEPRVIPCERSAARRMRLVAQRMRLAAAHNAP